MLWRQGGTCRAEYRAQALSVSVCRFDGKSSGHIAGDFCAAGVPGKGAAACRVRGYQAASGSRPSERDIAEPAHTGKRAKKDTLRCVVIGLEAHVVQIRIRFIAGGITVVQIAMGACVSVRHQIPIVLMKKRRKRMEQSKYDYRT